MTIINVYDNNFGLVGVLDSYVSIIWRPAYYDVGDFEVYTAVTPKVMELLQVGRILVRNTDITVDEDGNTTMTNVMIVKNIDLITDVENGDFISVTGRELKYILHSRIIWSQTNLAGTVEAGVRKLVTDNAISPTDTKRKLPNLILGATAGLSDRLDKQLTGEYLDEAITEICTSYNVGWDIYIYNYSYVFVMYKGADRSYSQSERPYVVFSDSFENLYNTEYQLMTEAYANTALIGGEGEGTKRKYTTINNTSSGYDRYELFVDARDLSSNEGTTEAISQADYIKLLQERGKEALAELSITEGFSGEVISNGNYKFRSDFDLGDTVTVINSCGITKNVMVLSAIESEDENGISLIPQFNI